MKTPEERFLPRIQFTDRCWLWTGAKNPQGYGQISVEGKLRLVHRFMYENVVGLIPEGLVLDHLCRTPLCVRPEHLEPVTNRVNLLRGNTFQAKNAAKTHCPQGHPYAGENVYIPSTRSERQCRTCRRMRKRGLL